MQPGIFKPKDKIIHKQSKEKGMVIRTINNHSYKVMFYTGYSAEIKSYNLEETK